MRTVAQFLVGRSGPIWAVHPDNTVREALVLMAEHNIGAVLVLVESRLAGVFSERDYARKVALQGRSSGSTPVREIMTPRERLVYVREGASPEDGKALMHQHRLERVLVVSDSFELRGLMTVKDITKQTDFPNAARDAQGSCAWVRPWAWPRAPKSALNCW